MSWDHMECEGIGQTFLFPERPHPSCAAECVKMKLHGQVDNQWSFQYYFQSLCLLVLHNVRNRTKMES